MIAFTRCLAPLALFLAVLTVGCKNKDKGDDSSGKPKESSLKGKIEGLWENTEPIENVPAGLLLVEFNPDGTFAMKAPFMGRTLITAKYALGEGEDVTLTDVKDGKGQAQAKMEGNVKIKVDGDNMTWINDKVTYKLARPKAKSDSKPKPRMDDLANPN